MYTDTAQPSALEPADPTPIPKPPHDVVLDGARIAALKDLGLLDSEAEEDFDRYTRLATDLLGVPVSLVSLVDADRQFFKSQSGLPDEMADVRQRRSVTPSASTRWRRGSR